MCIVRPFPCSHEFDLKTRHSVYSLVFGGFALWLKSNAVSQHMIQRYLALPTLRDAKKWVSTEKTKQHQQPKEIHVICCRPPFLRFIFRRALWLFILGALILLLSCSYCGLLIYATYHDCDPLTTKLAKAKDQLLPLLVMRIFGDFPGFPGLFVAGVFSAALRYVPFESNRFLFYCLFSSFFCTSFCRGNKNLIDFIPVPCQPV